MNEFKIHTIPLVFNTVCDFFLVSLSSSPFFCVFSLFVLALARDSMQKNIYIYSIYNIIK